MEQQNITAVKGIGEKTAKLFQKIGVETVEELLHYYPRAYDEFKEPQPIAELKEDTIAAVGGILAKTADVVRYGARLQVTTAGLRDSGGTLALAWYNMPYLRGTLKAGERFIFRGRVVKKRGRLTMEQPEIYRPEQYAKVVSSMQPVYGQTKGLGNKTIAKAVTEALTMRQMEREYLPAGLREKYGLAEINYALEHIHFPANREELMFSRKRLVFDEFFMFLMSVRLLKDKKEDKKLERWERIIYEAAKQSKRGKIPKLRGILSFKDALEDMKNNDLNIAPYENERTKSIKQAIKGVNINTMGIFVGPEGGFEESEIEAIEEISGKSVSLGPRILRTETASLVASSIVLYELSDLGGDE